VSASSQIVTGKKDDTKQSDYGSLADTWRRPWIECLLRCWTRSNSRKSCVAQCQAHTRFGVVIRNFQRQLSRRARTSKLNRLEDEL